MTRRVALAPLFLALSLLAVAAVDDYDGDGYSDSEETGALLADANLSGRVDGFDLAWLGREWGTRSVIPVYDGNGDPILPFPPNPDFVFDLDFTRDGTIDGDELSLLAVYFGHEPGGVVPPPPDATPPTAPSGLVATPVSSSGIDLSWTASTDNVGVTGYRVERCTGSSCTTFAQIGTSASVSYADTGLAAETTYRYRVRAQDAAGNLSPYSATASATTPEESSGQRIDVSTASELADAVEDANASGGDTTIVLADGTYTLADTLYVNTPRVTLRSLSGDRTRVTIEGDAMSASASVKNLIRVAAGQFTIRDLTLRRSGWHLIQIAGEEDADAPTIRNVVFRDAWEQMLKVTYSDSDPEVGSDLGVVEGCLFEFPSGQAGQYYTGGIDAHNARGWIVRGNTFRNIVSPSLAPAEHAIHFWSESADTLIEKNTILDCDRGIGLGLYEGRGHTGGVVRNNMIYHSESHGSYADVAIEASPSPGAEIYNNSIYMEHDYPNAIEYRFPGMTDGLIANNLTNRAITARDGATATVSSNTTDASASWFANPYVGDLHVTAAATAAVDSGQSISGLVDDFDGEARPQGPGIDRGADEATVLGAVATASGVTR